MVDGGGLPRTRRRATARARGTRAALAAGSALLWLACAPGLDAQLDEAQALVVAGQPTAALPLLEAIVRRRPDDGPANLLLGQVLLQTGQTRLAVAPLSRALESELHAVPAGLLLASAHLSDGRAPQALEVVDRVLARHPLQPAALRIRATAHLELGQAEAAAEDARRILEVAPEDSQAPMLLGTALTRLGRLDEAEAVLTALEEAAREGKAPTAHARACAALASFLAAGRQDPARAAAGWKSCLASHPADAVVLQGATAFFDQRGDAASSRAVLRRAIEIAPEDLGTRVALAQRLAAVGEAEEAEALLIQAAEGPSGWAAWQAVAELRQTLRDPEGAVQAQARALEEAPVEHADALRFQYGMMLLGLGRGDEARALRSRIENPALLDLLEGRAHLADGDAVAALEAFERGTARNPADARGHFLSGLAAQAAGHLDRAFAAYTAALERDPSATDAALAAARLHHALGEHGRALERVQRHRSTRGTAQREAMLLAARTTAALGETAAAIAMLEDRLAIAGDASDPETLALLVGILGRGPGPAAALARVDQARAAGFDLSAPGSLPVLQAYGTQAILAGAPHRGLDAFAAALQQRPEAVELHLARAGFLTAAGDVAAAEAALRRALEIAPEDPATLTALGSWLHARGRGDDALPLLEQARALSPSDPEPAFLAARILTERGEDDEAERRLRAVLQHSPFHVGACNDLAWRLAETGRDLDLALELARRAVRVGRSGATYDTLGWVQLARGEAGGAVASLEQAVALAPGEPGFRYRLGVALARTGRDAEARAALREALAQGEFPEAPRARAELARLGAP